MYFFFQFKWPPLQPSHIRNTNHQMQILLVHWNGNVFILTKSSSLAAPKVVKMTTFGAASDENFVKMTTFSFQCSCFINVLSKLRFDLILTSIVDQVHLNSYDRPCTSCKICTFGQWNKVESINKIFQLNHPVLNYSSKADFIKHECTKHI